MSQNDDFLKIFLEEACEHLQVIESSLLSMEKNPQDKEQIHLLFRSIHTIKGGAGLLGLTKVNILAHDMESILGKARNKEIIMEKEHIDALLAGYDRLNEMLLQPHESDKVDIEKEHSLLEDLLNQKMIISPSNDSKKLSVLQKNYTYQICLLLEEDLAQRDQSLTEYLQNLEKYGKVIDSYFDIINVNRNISGLTGESSFIFLFSSQITPEVIANALEIPPSRITETTGTRLEKKTNSQKFAEKKEQSQSENVPETMSTFSSFPATSMVKETEESIRVHVKRLNKLVDLAGELVLVRNQIFRVSESAVSHISGLKGILQNLNRITTEIQEEIMNTRMQPVGIIFKKTPRLIRQLSADLGKKIEIVTEGNDVELDKSIIEALSDPMTHIVRNIADHGIEFPEDRIKAGKPDYGLLLQKAFHQSGQVIIQVSDDGRGINLDQLTQKAIKKEIITMDSAAKMTDKEKLNLIFAPGLSTAQKISSVSGRGVGMDVVKNNIEQIGGTIDVNSVYGKGTTLTMTLPLTMAIISSLIAHTKNCWFAFPQVNVEEMVILKSEDFSRKIGHIQGQSLLRLRGNLLPLISLENGLNLSQRTNNSVADFADNETIHILIVKHETHRIAIIVDKILGNEEIVVKPIPEYLKHIKSFSGMTILGDGAIAMIIDIPGFMEHNQIDYVEQKLRESQILRNTGQIAQESESLLVFDNGTDERFALAIPLIRRVDTLQISKIQKIGNKEYIEYRGEQTRILRLEQLLPIQKPKEFLETAHIILPKKVKVPVCLLINRVIDTRNVIVNLEKSKIKGTGVLGSILLDHKITLLLDLYAILEEGEPDSIVTKGVVDYKAAQRRKILLVEDTPFFMKVIHDYLEGVGFKITTAINGKEALAILKKTEFDLVLTDIEMPIIDGRELLKQIRSRERWSKLPVIALTAITDTKIMEEGKQQGFNDWLIKLDKELLLKTLKKYL